MGIKCTRKPNTVMQINQPNRRNVISHFRSKAVVYVINKRVELATAYQARNFE